LLKPKDSTNDYKTGWGKARDRLVELCATHQGHTMTKADIKLYELVLENGRSSSPFVWRARYALAHKGLPFETVPLGFVDIPATFNGKCKTVPVLTYGELTLADSWDIAEHLDATFPGTPTLFSGPAEIAMVRLFDAWFAPTIMRRLFGIYALDIHDSARPEDRPYFRQSREARLKGKTLEQFTADRVAQVPVVREALAPLRAHLSRFPYLGGETPNYADYIALSAFLWVASISSLPLLDKTDDVMRAWFDRNLDLYGGIGHDARMKPLFD
jgi:glutathione S-transferase